MNRFGVVIGMAVLASSVAIAKEPVDRTVPAELDGKVQVENLVGSVTVKTWDEAQVRITGTLGDEVERLDVDRDDDEIKIDVVLPSRVNNPDGTDLVLTVPSGSEVEIETVSADVTVEDVTGDIEVQTVSGNVHLAAWPRDVSVETVSGRIWVGGSREEVQAESVSGAIEVENCEGDLELSTTSGRIEVKNGKYDSVECTSVSGEIRFEAADVGRGEFDLENFSGGIEVSLPANVSADFRVETFSGQVRSEFGGEVRQEQYGPGARLHTTSGAGDAQFEIVTFSGGIRLKKK